MTFSVSDSVNGGLDKLLNVGVIASVTRNPIYTSAVLALATVIIIILIYRGIESTYAWRAGFWVFVVSTLLLMLHNRILLKELQKTTKDESLGLAFSEPVEHFDNYVDIPNRFAPRPQTFAQAHQAYTPQPQSFAGLNEEPMPTNNLAHALI